MVIIVILNSPQVFDRLSDEYSKWKKLSIVRQVAKRNEGGLVLLSLDENTRKNLFE